MTLRSSIIEAAIGFRYAKFSAARAGDELTSDEAAEAVRLCMAAYRLAKLGQDDAARWVHMSTRKHDLMIDATSEQFINETGNVYFISPEV